MEVILELTNHYIDITELKVHKGKISIQKSVREKMPEGVFQNGIIINTNVVAQTIKDIIKEQQIRSKKAVFCMDGMDIIRKEIKIPKASPKQTRGIIENELNKAEALRNGYIFDYILSEPDNEADKKNYQMCSTYLLPEELIKNYETTAKRAGLNLCRVMPVSHCMERLSQLLKLQEEKNLTVLVHAEEYGVNILLSGPDIKPIYRKPEIREENSMEENMFIVSAVRQLQSFTSPLERVLGAVEESVSKLVQFQSQTSNSKSVERILVYGSLASDDDFIQQIENRCQIHAEKCFLPEKEVQISAGISKPFCIYHAVGSKCSRMLGEKKELSFVQIQGRASYVSMKERIPLLTGLACILILSVFYGVTVINNTDLNREISSLQDEITSIQLNSEYKEKEQVQEKLTKLNSYNESCLTCIELMENTVRPEPETFSSIDALVPEDIDIYSYSYADHTIVIQCSSNHQDGPAQFAEVLTNANLFSQVKYTGFSASTDIGGNSCYNFSLECTE